MSLTLKLLSKVFTPELNKLLVESLYNAYNSSLDHFAPEVGHDGMVFGLMVYKSSTYNLAELAQTDDRINIISRSPKFLMKIGRYKIGTYKVGDTGYIDPESSFPNNRIGAYQLTKANQAQRWLPFPELDQEPSEFDVKFTNLVLAHSGNSEEGLLKVFIGIPSEINEKHQIIAWSNHFDIWSKDKDGEDFLTIPKSDEAKTPAEKVAPPTLKLKTA
jgi:hypothetical protein